jgi:hypothetical protein
MINFDALVLGPAMAVFGQPITVTPLASQPGVAAYPAIGVFRAEPTSVPMDDGSIVASTIYTLGIRVSGFPIPPRPEDKISVGGGDYWIDRVHPDGQGGAILTLKKVQL